MTRTSAPRTDSSIIAVPTASIIISTAIDELRKAFVYFGYNSTDCMPLAHISTCIAYNFFGINIGVCVGMKSWI
ncbi:hypothetical protein NQ317_008087 [Molorchus minor]|uniref:Uncharacterized protein n=1 Tax=Molorchus minor TaxID=1323400 RepID=A0ABQ9JDD7_9CUCU|nr:hypothetical protein NQ317_008087 [Molorchus minor]